MLLIMSTIMMMKKKEKKEKRTRTRTRIESYKMMADLWKPPRRRPNSRAHQRG